MALNGKLISVNSVANFVYDVFILPSDEFANKYWNIYTDMTNFQNINH